MNPWVDFKAIKASADFRPVLAHYGLELKAKGPELVGLCPFHARGRLRSQGQHHRLRLEEGGGHHPGGVRGAGRGASDCLAGPAGSGGQRAEARRTQDRPGEGGELGTTASSGDDN